MVSAPQGTWGGILRTVWYGTVVQWDIPYGDDSFCLREVVRADGRSGRKVADTAIREPRSKRRWEKQKPGGATSHWGLPWHTSPRLGLPAVLVSFGPSLGQRLMVGGRGKGRSGALGEENWRH